MWHVVSFASGLYWKRPAKEYEKLPPLSNEDGLTAGHRSPGVFNKARVVELSHYGPRGVRLPRRSPSPEFHIICPERDKAKADAFQGRSTRCIQRSGDAVESNMSSTSPMTSNGQYTAASMPKELIEIQPITHTTLDNDHQSVWDDPEASPDSNGWYAEYRRWEGSLDVHMFPENNEQEDAVHLFTETFTPSEPLCPVTVPAPFGSGRKEKVKPDQEYSASAAALGYKGSYSQYPPHTNVSSSRGRVNGDDPNDNNNGSGSGDRRGGGGGDDGGRGGGRDDEDDREADSEQVAVASQSPPVPSTQQQEISQPLPLRYGESRRALPNDPRLVWLCVSFCLALHVSGAIPN
jgi:hypothetical protein